MARILLVDDDPDISDDLKDFLQACGHLVQTAFSGPEALEHLEFKKYDLILLDGKLPGKDGLDVAREFRLKGGLTPIILSTGLSPEELDEQSAAVQIEAYLRKPYSPESLDERISQLLR